MSTVTTYRHLDKMIMVTCGALLILTVILPNVFSQSNDLSSVLGNAQKSLDTNTKNASTLTTAPSITPHQFTIPKNIDIYVETTLIYDPSTEDWGFPENAKFNFAKANKICPQKDCVQVFDKISLFWTGNTKDEFMISGNLKVEDKSTNNSDVRSWKYYKPVAWAIKVTNVKEDIRTNQTSYTFDGLLGIGTHSGLDHPVVLYKIIGTFQEPLGLLKFTGKQTTQDQFFQSRSVG
jgi:hypothetical protein